MTSRLLAIASIYLLLASSCAAVDPAAIYTGGLSAGSNSNVRLRIGNGGAGQSGLVEALANQFIKDKAKDFGEAFQVAWYKSDTTYSIEYLKTGIVDVAITYSPSAEAIAIDQGIAKSPSYYAFRDHFLLVGPKSNPANISSSSDIMTIFSELYQAAQGDNKGPPVRFLSRFDKSATNLKESMLWITIGQVPWATAVSTWYHQYIAFPVQALTAAILLDEYTLTDRGTLLSLNASVRDQTVIYKAGSDKEDDPLLNPAHLLVGTKTENDRMAEAFAKWLVSHKGQNVIASFRKNGEQLYSPAPRRTGRQKT